LAQQIPIAQAAIWYLAMINERRVLGTALIRSYD
jgi:hypothetical protein